MAYMKVLIFIAKAHGNNLTAMFPTPCIYMSILQQVVAHLTFISSKYHLSIACLNHHIISADRLVLSLRVCLYQGHSSDLPY